MLGTNCHEVPSDRYCTKWPEIFKKYIFTFEPSHKCNIEISKMKNRFDGEITSETTWLQFKQLSQV